MFSVSMYFNTGEFLDGLSWFDINLTFSLVIRERANAVC